MIHMQSLKFVSLNQLLLGIAFSSLFFSVESIYEGIPLSEHSRYAEAKQFSCDGGVLLPINVVNDDYCDCNDGSDEPGTSACSHTYSTFYCSNVKHIPIRIATSKVNDGICDCCDGSDEYKGYTKCEDHCAHEAAILKAAQEKKKKVIQDGIEIRKQYVQEAAKLLQDKEGQLEELEKVYKEKESGMNTAEQNLQVEEKIEAQERHLHKKEFNLEIAKRFGLSDLPMDSLITLIFELANQVGSGEGLLDLIKQQRNLLELGETTLESEQKIIFEKHEQASREREERIQDKEREMKEKRESSSSSPSTESLNTPDMTAAEQTSEASTTDSNEGTTENEANDESEVEEPELAPAISAANQSLLEFNNHQYSRQETKVARNQFEQAQREFDTSKKSYDDLKDELSLDFGNERQFWTLKGQCFEVTVGKYVYKVCPYDTAKQDSTSLGTWSKLEENGTVMVFENGQQCWNGPSRSMKVHLQCGTENRLHSINEPFTCVYTSILETPAVCHIDQLQKISSTPIVQHDEL